jgi:transcription antitermination factor NusG
VIGIVGIGYTPTPIDYKEIADIQRVVKSELGVAPHPFLRVGQHVRINSGALYGLEGLIVELKKRSHLIVSVSLLQRSVAVEIDSAWATPLFPSRTKTLCTKRLLSPA